MELVRKDPKKAGGGRNVEMMGGTEEVFSGEAFLDSGICCCSQRYGELISRGGWEGETGKIL